MEFLPGPYIEDVPGFINESVACFDPNEAAKGRKSFPSGHTSFAFAGATLCAMLSYYYSRKMNGAARLFPQSNHYEFRIPGASLSIAFLCICYIPAIYVAISRTQVILL